MPIVCAKDARNKICEFKRRAEFQATYSAFGGVSGLVSGCNSFSGSPARGLYGDSSLNQALSMISVSRFSSFFPSLVWPFVQLFGRVLCVSILCEYKGSN